MARRRGDWVAFSEQLVKTLESMPVADPEITMTIEEIKEATGTMMTIESLRNRGYWKAGRLGKKYFDTQTKAGLALQEHHDAEGQVVAVTYRLSEAPVTT
jgi:hypothetical protein